MGHEQREQASPVRTTGKMTRRQAREARRAKEQLKKEIAHAGQECDRLMMKKIQLERQLEFPHKIEWERRLRMELRKVELELREAQFLYRALKEKQRSEQEASCEERSRVSKQGDTLADAFDWSLRASLAFAALAFLFLALITAGVLH